MTFKVNIGHAESHLLEFSYNQVLGNLVIRIDGKVAKRDFRFLSLFLVKSYELKVGITEKLVVRIEKERKLFLSFLRPQKYRVFVDGELVRSFEGF